MTFLDDHIDRITELISKKFGITPVKTQRGSNNFGGAREMRFRNQAGAEKLVTLEELLSGAVRIKMFDGSVGVFEGNFIKWK